MKILVAGRGRGGSWIIRGDQLGHAIGATVDPQPTSLKGYDVVIVVKRPRPEVLEMVHKRGVPLVWDILDAYPAEALQWDAKACIEWFGEQLKAVQPTGVVAATQAMAADCKHFGVPVLALPHHARPGQATNPLREKVAVVGYQGGDYLGRWLHVLERQCRARGWQFRPDYSKTADMQLADVDIVVALRDQDGYAARQWKSNVKLANAQGSGTPSVVSRTAGYSETAGSRQYFADDEVGLAGAFDVLTSHERRKEEVDRYRPPKLRHVAERYSDWLYRLISGRR